MPEPDFRLAAVDPQRHNQHPKSPATTLMPEQPTSRADSDIGIQASPDRDARATTNAGLDAEDVAGLANRQ
jgi:hypothetical protein